MAQVRLGQSETDAVASRGDAHCGETCGIEPLLQCTLRRGLSVHEDDVTKWTATAGLFRILNELMLVGVGAKTLQDLNFGFELALDAEDADARASLCDSSPEGAFRLEPDDEHAGALVLDCPAEVM